MRKDTKDIMRDILSDISLAQFLVALFSVGMFFLMTGVAEGVR